MTEKQDFHDDDDDLSGSFEDFMGDDDVSEDDLADFLSDGDDQQTLAGNVDLDDEDFASSFLSDEDDKETTGEDVSVGSEIDVDLHEADLEDDELVEMLSDEELDMLSDSDVQIPAIPHGTVEPPFYQGIVEPEASADAEPETYAEEEDDLDPETLWGEDELEIDDDEFDLEPDDLEVADSGIDGATEYYTESMESDAVSGDDISADDNKEPVTSAGDDESEQPDAWETGSRDTLNQRPYESDFAPTILSDMPEEDPEFSRSIGRIGTMLSGESFADDDEDEFLSAGPATDAVGVGSAQVGMSSQNWGTSSGAGLSSSLNVRERPVSGHEAPFTVQQDADYEVIEELARGGMGVVYIARQTSLDRMLAIKTLKLPDGSGSSGRGSRITRLQRECFLSEALVTANLVHPNIVPIHDLCQTKEGIPFYSMKRVKGVPWVSAAGPNGRTSGDIKNDPIRTMGLGENLEVLLKVCDATAYAHSQGVVNRDLKPENVIIGDFGEVIVLDWGLAIFTPDSGRQNPESSTVSFGAGTAAYMAPELWTGPGEAIGRWSDIYLLGGMLFEILTGYAPHKFEIPKGMPKNPTPTERQRLKIDQINDVVGNNRIRETDVQSELMDIALKAMETDPDDRYKSVQEFQAAIREYQRHEESRHLTRRADQLMQGKTGAAKEGYEDYQTAAALYEEALRGWDGNQAAKEGLHDARLNNAKLAYKRGDFDLGLQLVAGRPDADEYVSLQKKLEKAKKRRGAQKWTIASLMGIVMIGGPVAAGKFYLDNKALNEAGIEISNAEAKANAAKRLAEEEQVKADRASQQADLAAQQAEVALAEAEKLKGESEQLNKTIEKSLVDLTKAQQEKTEAETALITARNAEAAAMTAAAEAMRAATTAQNAIAQAKQDIAKLEEDTKKIEAEKEVALKQQKAAAFEVDLQKVASQTLSLNLKEAGDSIDELLQSDKLQALDEVERTQRIRELEAQKAQLLRLLSQDTGSPVQSQHIHSNGNLVAWIHGATVTDEAGRITVRTLDPETQKPAEQVLAEWKLDAGEFIDVQFTSKENTIACLSNSELTLWNYVTDERTSLGNGNGNSDFTSIVGFDNTLITATRSGIIQGWSLTTFDRQLWQFKCGTAVMDLTLINGMNLLICAGSRANTSADVLALKITPQGLERLEKGTQLQFTKDALAPPQVVAVSPHKDQLMVLGNSRNGSILVLPKARAEDAATSKRRNPFPFDSPAELEESGATNWQQSWHRRPVNAIAFSPDGKRFATASDDRTIGIWDVDQNTGSVKWNSNLQLKGHGAAVTDVAFVDNDRVLSTSRDRTSRVWNLTEYPDQLKQILNFTEQSGKASETANSRSTGPEAQPPMIAPTISARPWLPNSSSQSNPASTRPKPQYQLAAMTAQPPATSADVPYVVLNDSRSSTEILRGGIGSVAITADGSRAAAGGVDGTAVLWNTASGLPVRGASQQSIFHRRSQLFEEGHKFNVSKLIFLPPNEHICLSTSFDGSLCLWQANPQADDLGAEKNRLTGIRLINAVAASPDGSFIVTSALTGGEVEESALNSHDRYPCRIWNVNHLLTGKAPAIDSATLNGFHQDIVTSVAVSADSRLIATGAKDGYLAVWNATNGALLSSVRAHDDRTLITDVAWLGSDQLLTVGVDGGIHLWAWSAATDTKPSGLTIVRNYDGKKKSPVDRLAVSPDGSQFLTVHATFLANPQAKDLPKTNLQQDLIIYEVKVRGISEPAGQAIRLAQAPEEKWTVPGDLRSSAGIISSVDWTADGSQVAIVAGGQINLLDSRTWELKKVLSRKSLNSDITAAVYPSALSEASGRNLIATFDGAAAQLWNLDSGKLETTFQPQQNVRAIALSRDDQHAFLATGDRSSLRIYNSKEDDAGYAQTLCKKRNPHPGGVTALAFAEDHKQLASGGEDGTVRIWNWEPSAHQLEESVVPEEIEDLKSGSVVDLKWSTDGGTLLVVCEKQGFLLNLNADPPQKIALDLPGQAAQNAVDVGDTGNQDASERLKFRCGDLKRNGSAIVLGGLSDLTGGSVGLLYKLQDGAYVLQPNTLSGHGAGGMTCAKFVETPESPYLVSGGNDGAAIIWNWSATVPYEAYRFLMRKDLFGAVHRAAVTDLAVAESTGAIATCSDDGTAIIWKNPLVKSDSL